MKSKEEILAEITGIDIDLLPHDTVRASDALDAMEIYHEQIIEDRNTAVDCLRATIQERNELKEKVSYLLPDYCINHDSTEGGRFCEWRNGEGNKCKQCIND